MTPGLARADLITGLVLVVIGLGALALSLDMPRFADRNINPYTVPGLVPGALALIIAVLGAVLAGRAVRAGGWKLRSSGIRASRANSRQVGLTLILTLGYAAVLVGRMPFWLATFLFTLAFVLTFEQGDHARGWPRRIAFAALYAAALSAAVTYVFQEIFLVRLP